MKLPAPKKPRFTAFKRFSRQEDGTAMIEFSVVLPVFAFLFLGFAAMAQADRLNARVGKVAATVSDIIAKSPTVSAAQIDAALLAGQAIAGNIDGALMKIKVVGVEVRNNGTTRVKWARGTTGTALPAVNTPYGLPTGLTTEPGYIIVANTQFAYEPPVGRSLLGDIDMEYSNYFVPRVSATTPCPDC